MKSKDTLPWTSKEARSLPWKMTSIDIRNNKDQTVVLRPSATPDAEINQRMFNDAEFIARAVNSHEVFLEAAKCAVQVFEFSIPENQSRLTIDKLKKAIAQAEGKP